MEDFREEIQARNIRFQWKLKQDKESLNQGEKIPKYPVIFLTCMDPRIDVHRIFQLKIGDVFVLRNAGNLFTNDTLRSVLIAIHEYGVKNVIVMGHIDCGMKKVRLPKLRDELGIEALKLILRNETNQSYGLMNFFKVFADEIGNIKRQLASFRQVLPSYVKLRGLLYDHYTGWVFDESEFMNYNRYEAFKVNYQKMIQNKKYKLIDYIESIEDQIVREPAIDTLISVDKKMESNVKSPPISESKTISESDAESDIKGKIDLIEPDQDFLQLNKLMRMPKITIPKIYIPKINIQVPKIYKEKKEVT